MRKHQKLSIRIGLLVAVLISLVALAAVTVSADTHEHIYGTEWKSSAKRHWQECTDPNCPDIEDSIHKVPHDGPVCSVCGVESHLVIGNIQLNDGEYLASNGTAATTTKPADNYAYFKDGVLTFHNFSVTVEDQDEAVYYAVSFKLVLEGENTVTNMSGYGIKSSNCLEVQGSGKLTVNSDSTCIYSAYDMTIADSTLTLTSENKCGIYAGESVTITKGAISGSASNEDVGICGQDGGVIITDSRIDIAQARWGIYSNDAVRVENTTANIVSEDYCIDSYDESMVITNCNLNLATNEGIGLIAYIDLTIENSTITGNAFYIGFDAHDITITKSIVDITADEHAIDCRSSVVIEDSSVTLISGCNTILAWDVTITNSNFLGVATGQDRDYRVFYADEPVVYDPDLKIIYSFNADGSESTTTPDPEKIDLYRYIKTEAKWEGWVELAGDTYYYKDGAKVTGWLELDGKRLYATEDGTFVKGFVTIDGKGYYFGDDYTMFTGWLDLDGTWYYFSPKGVMTTGWLAYGPVWYYFNNDGVMHTGWLYYGGQYYYFDTAATNYGRMAANKWIQDSSKWYYINASGYRVTGQVTIDGKVNKFDENGVWLGEVVQNGWIKENNKWYYYKNGAKTTGWLDLGGTWYYFKANGEMTTGWLAYGPVWYYFNPNGDMRTGWLTYGGHKYYFDTAATNYGRMAVNKWIKDGGKWYYFDANGYRVTGSHTIGGKVYNFDANGICLNP